MGQGGKDYSPEGAKEKSVAHTRNALSLRGLALCLLPTHTRPELAEGVYALGCILMPLRGWTPLAMLRHDLDFMHHAQIFMEQDVAVKYKYASNGWIGEIHPYLHAVVRA